MLVAKFITKSYYQYQNHLQKKTLSIAIICALASSISTSIIASEKNPATPPSFNQQAFRTQLVSNSNQIQIPQKQRPKIQIAILLDTSGSMDGLINQTRNQLWQVVNEFSSVSKGGVRPTLEVALFEYGNSTNQKSEGYVRKLNGLTKELDKISEGLFSLTTNGGDEYCGLAIKTAVNSLQWSRSNQDIKTIFIAGNEPFTQGPVNYQAALKMASQAGISVNTIHAGNHQVGIQTGWQSAASLAGGDYMSIDANQRIVHVAAPQDKKLAALNSQLNETYVPYGSRGKASAARQQAQDSLSSNISTGLLAQRAKSKSSSFYDNAEWDLVDAVNQGKIDKKAIAELDESTLPKPMLGLSDKQKESYVQEKAKARTRIKQEIAELSRSRDTFVAEKRREEVSNELDMSDALTQSIKRQVQEKRFEFGKEKTKL
jgi:hypothetical protein